MKKIKGTYSFKVKNVAGKECVWFVDCKNGSGSVETNSNSKFCSQMKMSSKNFVWS